MLPQDAHHTHPAGGDDARSVLQGAGLRATHARIAVYEILRDIGGHRSVDEIVTHVTRRGESIARMSVYNVVTDLQAAGLVMCADAGPGRALYEIAHTWHHHFVCRVCKKIIDVPCIEGRKPCLEPPVDIGATIEEAQVIFRGVCGECRDAEGENG